MDSWTSRYEPLLGEGKDAEIVDGEHDVDADSGATDSQGWIRSGAQPAKQTERQKPGLSLLAGVFVPCVMSLFSVILFLRMGYVIAQFGLYVTLVVLGVCVIIIVCTIFSMSALATNGTMLGGGAYFIISRSLGPEVGGAIGIMFFLANIFSCALYATGFVEAVTGTPGVVLPTGYWYGVVYAEVVVIMCTTVCVFGAGAFGRASLLIFSVSMISLADVLVNFFIADPNAHIASPAVNPISFTNLSFTGFSSTTLESNLYPAMTHDYVSGSNSTASTVFGLLFNGCTGVMAGANLSGDLANASKSIPRGTLLASTFAFIIYFVVFILTAATCDRALLNENYSYLAAINNVPALVMTGTYLLSLAASLNTFIGSSRLLMAIARDGLLGRWTAVFANELPSVGATWLLVSLVVMVPTIETIAQFSAMFFLLSYGTTNFACLTLLITAAPNFRPSFKYFSGLSATTGGVGCIAAMLFIDLSIGLAVIAFMLLMMMGIAAAGPDVEWGDVTQALAYRVIRRYLLSLKTQSLKYWRPEVLLLVEKPRRCMQEIFFASELKKGGLYILGSIIPGEVEAGASVLAEYKRKEEAWRVLVEQTGLKAFVDCYLAPTVRSGAQALMMTAGLGQMRPNILLLGFPGEESAGGSAAAAWVSKAEEAQGAKLFSRRKVIRSAGERVNQALVSLDSESVPNLKVGARQFTGILEDAAAMGLSAGVLRGFAGYEQRLDAAKVSAKLGKAALLIVYLTLGAACFAQGGRSALRWHLDVWITRPSATIKENDDGYNLTVELLLQLGSIVHHHASWQKSTKFRVLTVVESRDAVALERQRVQALVHDLRIRPELHIVSLDSNRSLEPEAAAHLFDASASPRERQSALNGLVAGHSQRTVLTLASLPLREEGESDADYLEAIDTLSTGLPPTVLLRGAGRSSTTRDDAI